MGCFLSLIVLAQPRSMSAFKEVHIQDAIIRVLEQLRALGVLNYYVNIEGGRRDVRQQVQLKRAGVRPGRPDLQLLLNDGKSIHIEVKVAPRGKLSEHQKNEIQTNERLGHKTYVIKAATPEEAIAELWGILEEEDKSGIVLSPQQRHRQACAPD